MTLIFAHRGSKGTHPENTLAAFKEAVRVKADGIELDIQFSKDEDLMVIHDGDVKRTTNGEGLVKDLTLKELKALDAGSWFDKAYSEEKIPLFKEVLALLEEEKYTGILNIEIKTDEYDYMGIESKILETLKEFDLSCDILFSSFNTETMERVMALDTTTPKAVIMDKSERKINFGKDQIAIGGIHPSIEWIKENKEIAREFPKAVRPWTVNTKEDMALCFELGLAAFHTDFPERAMMEKDAF